MSTTANDQTLRIVVASPSDVAKERAIVKNVIDDLNVNCGRFFGIRLELSRWEDVPPGVHDAGAQGRIDDWLEIEGADILVGIFWKRFGTPIPGGETGAEHEIRVALDRWSKCGDPEIMLYFNDEGVARAHTEDIEQMLRLRRFRDEFEKRGLVHPYLGVEDFAIRIRNHLTNVISGRAAARFRPDSIPCGLSAVSKIMRGEGIAELTGELRLSIPRRPDQGDAVVTLTVSLNTNVTNTMDERSIAQDALLIVEGGPGETMGQMVTHGRVAAANALSFDAVRLPLRGPGDVVTVRLIGIRANAFARAYLHDDVLAFVKIEAAAGATFALVNPQATIGTTYSGFGFSTNTASPDCTPGTNEEFALGLKQNIQTNFVCTFHENYPDAFKNRVQEGISEAYRGPTADAPHATSGTLLGLHFSMVPAGVTIYVTVFDRPSILETHPAWQRAPSARLRFPDPEAGQIDGTTGKMVPVPLVGNSATAVWEWTNEDPEAPLRVDAVAFGVAIVSKPGESGWGSCKVQAALHPLSNVHTASRTAPVPRFAVPGSDLLTLSFPSKPAPPSEK